MLYRRKGESDESYAARKLASPVHQAELERKRAYGREYRAQNRDWINRRTREYRAKHWLEIKLRRIKWGERREGYYQEYYAKNVARINARRRARYAERQREYWGRMKELRKAWL